MADQHNSTDKLLGRAKLSRFRRMYPNYEDFTKLPLWEVEEAVYLISDQQPIEPDFLRDEHGVPISKEKHYNFRYHDMDLTYDLIIRGIAANELQLIKEKYLAPVQVIRWAKEKDIKVPKPFLVLLKTEIIHDEELTGTEKQELGSLRVQKENLDNAIIAAVQLTLFCSDHKKEFTKKELHAELRRNPLYNNISNTVFKKIWEALPLKYRNKGGCPRKLDKPT